MNLPFQPHNRAGLTPVNKIQVASSGSEAGRARRGFTPRSASRAKTAPGSRNGNVKPKLTPAQQLEIIRRLETRNFKVGTGLNQFYEEFTGNPNPPASIVSKLTCKQNLFASFASVDPIASSTRNYGNSMVGSMESLVSAGGMGFDMSATVSGMDVTTIEAPIRAPVNRLMEEEGCNSLPVYFKTFERFLSLREIACQSLDDVAEIRCATKFSQLLPQEKMVTFFKSLEKVQKIMQKFVNGNASKNMKLFIPFPKSKDASSSVIHCDVKDQSDVINAFYKLTEIMRRLNSFTNRETIDFKLDAKLEYFKDLVNKLEDSIKKHEEVSYDLNDIDAKFKDFEEGIRTNNGFGVNGLCV